MTLDEFLAAHVNDARGGYRPDEVTNLIQRAYNLGWNNAKLWLANQTLAHAAPDGPGVSPNSWGRPDDKPEGEGRRPFSITEDDLKRTLGDS